MSIRDIKQDWETVKKRWEAWWNNDIYDRTLVQVTAPLDGVEPADPELMGWTSIISGNKHGGAPLNVDPKDMWTDIDFMIRRTLEVVRTTYFGGESAPLFYHNWAVGHALPFGCEPHFERDTIWVDPAPVGKDGYPSFDGWRESPWWDWIRRSTESAARASQGRYFVMPVWGNHAADNLSLIRGTEQLLMDITLNREWMESAVWILSRSLIEMCEDLWELVSPEVTGMEGSLDYCSCWSPGKSMGFDCDTSYMVSPKDFEEIFLPPLVEAMRTVDCRIFHIDGIGVSRHIDALLDVPELQAFQWLPGPGREEIMQWIPLIQKIQAKGKGVLVYAEADEIEPFMREVNHEGLCIGISAGSESEAKEIVNLVGRLT